MTAKPIFSSACVTRSWVLTHQELPEGISSRLCHDRPSLTSEWLPLGSTYGAVLTYRASIFLSFQEPSGWEQSASWTPRLLPLWDRDLRLTCRFYSHHQSSFCCWPFIEFAQHKTLLFSVGVQSSVIKSVTKKAQLWKAFDEILAKLK